MKQVYEAAMRVHRTQERIRELRESLEQCEPVKAWRDAEEALTLEQREAGVTMTPEPQFCAKREPLRALVQRYGGMGAHDYEDLVCLHPDEVPAFIAVHWCAACQRNSPKVVEIRALNRALGSYRGTLTKACRKAAKGGEG